ncbi:ferric reduction oxidase 2-like [Diospyros lotus]|uniref:ferric reduction oxidase 2-like n=1 Tax=Diospyros lotus TaxID=55363 RepID=UPI00225ACE59|nr:ferric reduction oxidase 2-like [Diospyros lotus]
MQAMAVKRLASPHGYGGVKLIRSAIMGLIVGISLGYMMMWVVTGARIYRTWYMKIRAKTNSTYFGWTGVRILIYTFPILLIAVLGSVYLHLGKKASYNKHMERNSTQFGAWKRPMVIKGLGIVSGIELAIFTMFIALLVWCFSAYMHLFFSEAAHRAVETGDKIWEAKLDMAGLILGLVGNVCLAFLFFPVTRGSSLLPLFGLTSEASIKYHIWLGHITMFLFTFHGILYIIYWVVTNRFSKMLEWSSISVSNVAGEVSLLCGLLLWVTTYPSIRQKMFELFFYTHYLYILFMVFYIFHLGFSYSFTILPGFYLFLVDRYLRFLQSRQGVALLAARILPCQTLELNFSKSPALSYSPTSMIFINVPSISKLQWHPFTISSSSNLDPDRLSVIIKNEGSWTKKLYQMLSPPSPVDHLNVSVEGPYGPVSTHFLGHGVLVMVSGGSGIAPFISIIRELIFASTTLKRKTPRILLISAFKYSSDLTMLELLTPIAGNPSELSKLELQVEAYVTREREPPPEKPKTLQTIWFKPAATDAPISPTLGQNGWLWLAAIISSSFVIFLLIMGILTRYYIYPIDHNTYKIYPHSSQATLSMLLMCITIAMAATAAFLWNKKQNAMEAKQIRNNEGGAAPVESSNLRFGNDRELESQPQQSLSKSIKVNYNGRPELKRILLQLKEPRVGVLVCGPKEMRHDVAAICSSGLADNLHFESISFNW